MAPISTTVLKQVAQRLLPAVFLSASVIHGADAVREAVKLNAGSGTVLDFASDIRRAYTSNPEVADPSAVSSRELLINARLPGNATVIVWLASGDRIFLPVAVSRDLGDLRRLLREAFPNESIQVHGMQESVALVGHVSSSLIAERAAALAAPVAKSVVSNLEVAPPPSERQIALRVLFAEVERNAVDELAVNLVSTGAANTPGQISTQQFGGARATELKGTIGGPVKGTVSTFTLSDVLNIFAFRPDLNLGAMIRALQSKGVLQILAEPTLVATDGKEANFVVGGEFPVPVLQNGATPGAVTVQFREFGIRLHFLPRISANGAIKLHVRPEVSTLDVANGVIVSGFTIPALATRRIETDVELKEGQSFAIGGLVDNRLTETIQRIPGLASLPLVGTLFRSRSASKSRTELVVVVTPELRAPVDTIPADLVPRMPEQFLGPVPEKRKHP